MKWFIKLKYFLSGRHLLKTQHEMKVTCRIEDVYKLAHLPEFIHAWMYTNKEIEITSPHEWGKLQFKEVTIRFDVIKREISGAS
jgi:hypothetical protein